MYRVYLCKMVYKNELIVGWFVKPASLGISPFVGLQVCDKVIDDATPIEEVWITPNGAVVCELPKDKWRVTATGAEADCNEAEWPDVLGYATQGWTEVKDFETLDPVPSEEPPCNSA